MKKSTMRFLVCFVLLVGLHACSGGGGSGGIDVPADGENGATDTIIPGAGKTGAPISDVQRIAALNHVSSEVSAVQGMDDSVQNETLARYLASQPEFEEAGFGPGGAWGRFTDGRLLVLDNEDTSQPSPATPASSLAKQAPSASDSGGKLQSIKYTSAIPAWTEIPASTPLCLYSSTAGNMHLFNLKEFINSKYSDGESVFSYTANDPNDNLTVEAMKAIPSDCALIAIAAHGSDMAYTRSGEKVYAVYTSTRVNPLLEALYNDLLNSGQLAYYHPVKPVGMLEPLDPAAWLHYAFTAGFVQNYWVTGGPRFADSKPFVHVNTCRGYNAVSRPLIDAIFASGASLYAGWAGIRSFDEDAPKTASYIFDRLLGVNMWASTKNKPHRPFSWGLLADEMKALGLGSTPDSTYGTIAQPNSELKFEPAPSNKFRMLAPSIKYMEIDEKHGSSDSPVLTIYGTFGNDRGQGKVVLDNEFGKSELEIITWGEDKITCKLSPDDAGDVVVSVNGNHSNKRRISKWKGKVTFTADRPTVFTGTISCDLNDTVTWDLIIRADIESYRSMPGTDRSTGSRGLRQPGNLILPIPAEVLGSFPTIMAIRSRT